MIVQPTLKLYLPSSPASRDSRPNRRITVSPVWVRKTKTKSLPAPERVRGVEEKCQKSVIPFPSHLSELERKGQTTVMIKNIPNQFR